MANNSINSTENYFSFSSNYLIVMISLNIVANILVLIGLVNGHRKMNSIESACLFSFCLLQSLGYAIQLYEMLITQRSLFDCYVHERLNLVWYFLLFVILMISFNRVHIIRQTMVYKKRIVLDDSTSLMERYRFSLLLMVIFALISFGITSPAYVQTTVLYVASIPISQNVNGTKCYINKNWLYLFMTKVIGYWLLNFFVILNYSIIIPYYVIKYRSKSESVSSKNTNSKTKNNISRTKRAIILITMKLGFYSFINSIVWLIVSVVWMIRFSKWRAITNGQHFTASSYFENTYNMDNQISIICSNMSDLLFLIEPFILLGINKVIRRSLISFITRSPYVSSVYTQTKSAH
jgi:hypothetical protein